MPKHHHEGFGSFQANVGRASASLNVVGAWFVFFVSVCLAVYGAYVYVKTSRDPTATAEERKVADAWALGSGLFVLVSGAVVLLSRWWSSRVYENKGFAEMAGTMAEVNMVSDALRPQSSAASFNGLPF
jgi:hypothetical protein